MEMSYGTTGSLFRSGSRQTFFATQVTRSAFELLQIVDWTKSRKIWDKNVNWYIRYPDTQTSMPHQSSTCSTIPHSTCSEVRVTKRQGLWSIKPYFSPCNAAAARVNSFTRDPAGEGGIDCQTVDCCPGADQRWKQGQEWKYYQHNLDLGGWSKKKGIF